MDSKKRYRTGVTSTLRVRRSGGDIEIERLRRLGTSVHSGLGRFSKHQTQQNSSIQSTFTGQSCPYPRGAMPPLPGWSCNSVISG